MSGYCGDCGYTMCQCYKHKKEQLREPDSLKGSFLDAITTLKAELAEARAEIEEHGVEMLKATVSCALSLKDELAEANETIGRLRGYTQHQYHDGGKCPKRETEFANCTCGLDELLKGDETP